MMRLSGCFRRYPIDRMWKTCFQRRPDCVKPLAEFHKIQLQTKYSCRQNTAAGRKKEKAPGSEEPGALMLICRSVLFGPDLHRAGLSDQKIRSVVLPNQ